MSRMPLVEPEALPPYLKAIHDATPEDNWLARNFARAFGPNPALVESYQSFYLPWHTGGAGVVEPRLKELVRLRIATLNGCVLCKSVRMAPETVTESEAASGVDHPEAANFTPRERAAIRFAEKMAVDHHNIGDDDVAEMRRHFSDAEFLELAMMAGQYIGFGRVLALLQLEVASCPID
ncbi:carboxymuconolactone decarboxylase family protein [Sandaracinobacteroides sp. A072]|uniref:carboxymuconolactone decarboxylase family protein n=1 Tax=Sandaracinobacteroides sp. A072 TaxID=3461146 RepID=UPI004040EEE7